MVSIRSIAVSATLCILATPSFSQVDDTTLEDLSLPALWQTYIWNSVPGAIQPPAEAAPAEANALGAIDIAVNWPMNDDFRFFSIEPQTQRGAIPFALKSVALWIRGASDGHSLELHFTDAEGEDRKMGFGINFEGWQQKAADIPTDWPQPLTFASITSHNWGMKNAGGTVITGLAGLTGAIDRSQRLAEPSSPVLAVLPSIPFGVAEADGTCSLQVRLMDWEAEGRELQLRSTVVDVQDTVVAESEETVSLLSLAALEQSVVLPQYGTYSLTAVASDASGEIARTTTGLAHIPPPAALTPEQFAASSIGVNTHVHAPWGLFGRLGIHWARDYSWGWLGKGETAPMGNGLDFADVSQQAANAGVGILPITMATFRNEDQTAFTNDVAAIQEGFARLSAALPGIRYWEIDNEFDLHLAAARFDEDNYVQTLRAAQEGLAQVGDATLVLNGTAGIHYTDTASLVRSDAADAFGVVNYHFYTGTSPPEVAADDANVGGEDRNVPLTFLDQVQRINELSHDAGKEAWLTEVGWDADNGPAVGETLQALYLPRAYLLCRLVGTDKVFWFFDRDTEGDGIFSTCGLLRLDNSLRPCAITMAALSQQTAATSVVGSVDLGPSTWAVVLRAPDGSYVVPVWTVSEERPVPEELAGLAAVDVLGNPCEPMTVGPAITYFSLDALPPGWGEQLGASWESLTTLTGVPGGSVTASASPGVGSVRWEQLPPFVDASDWVADGGIVNSQLTFTAAAPAGRHSALAVVEGDGWRREWPIALSIEPALTVDATTYEPNQPTLLHIRSQEDLHVTARLVDADGVIAPTEFDLGPGREQRCAVVPPLGASGPIRVELALSNGVTQVYILRSTELVITEALGADLPDTAMLPTDAVATHGDITGLRIFLGRSDSGLIVAADMPVNGVVPGNPMAFWDATNLEVFIEPDATRSSWGARTRQFFIVPVQADGEWAAVIGQWDKQAGRAVMEDAIAATVQVTDAQVHLRAVIPWDKLGFSLNETGRARLGLALQGVCPDRKWEAAWPRLKDDGLLDGPGQWGLVTTAP